MDSDSLRWFQHVVDGVTVTEVADIFGVSQPGVSRALARLEAEVGAPLLHRTGRTLRPTHAGAVFKRHVDSALHRLDDGVAAVAELVDPETGTVTLAFPQSLGTWLVPALVRTFRRAHPFVQFELRASDGDSDSPILTESRVDLQFTARYPDDPEVHWKRLLSQQLALAVPADHALAGRDGVSIVEAAAEEFVMLTPTWTLRALTEELCASAGFTPRVSFEGADLPVVRGFVEAGLGVAVVPLPSHSVQNESLVPLTDTDAHRDLGLAWARSRRLLPSAELFRSHVLATATAQQL